MIHNEVLFLLLTLFSRLLFPLLSHLLSEAFVDHPNECDDIQESKGHHTGRSMFDERMVVVLGLSILEGCVTGNPIAKKLWVWSPLHSTPNLDLIERTAGLSKSILYTDSILSVDHYSNEKSHKRDD